MIIIKQGLVGIGVALLVGFFATGVSAQEVAPEEEIQSPSEKQQEEENKAFFDSLKKTEQSPRFQYNAFGRRDPFLSFVGPNDEQREKMPPLQRVSISEMKLIGVAWGSGRVSAMVQTPDGKSYPVQRGTRIGINQGRVSQIGRESVTVEEPYINIFGRAAQKQVVMKLYTKKEK